eukprot:1883670-Rhodomonas_salina.2
MVEHTLRNQTRDDRIPRTHSPEHVFAWIGARAPQRSKPCEHGKSSCVTWDHHTLPQHRTLHSARRGA